jgi:DNA-binding MarR family transcriptional regulator
MLSRLNMSSLKLADGLESDGSGCLFDPTVRATLNRIGGGNGRALEAISALRLAAKRLHEATERWAEGHGLTESRLQILTYLYFNPDHQMSLGQLAEAQNLVPRTVTGLVDKLERDGLVRRVADPSDRRSVRAQLTKAGLARIGALRKDAAERQALGTGGLKPRQLAELRHLCLLLVKQLDAVEGRR